jgi:UDP-N-acetylglucosamine:LPS N-acetylglucosamine transferase
VKSIAETLPADLKARYHMPCLICMRWEPLLPAADLVLSRAGASSTWVNIHSLVCPPCLVPYPYAWRYQKVNADYLAERNAAVILQDELVGRYTFPVLKDLLKIEHKREAMRTAMQKLSNPNAADAIASQLVELAGVQTL